MRTRYQLRLFHGIQTAKRVNSLISYRTSHSSIFLIHGHKELTTDNWSPFMFPSSLYVWCLYMDDEILLTGHVVKRK